MSLQFVNLKGEPVSTTPVKGPAKPKTIIDSFHKGWHVVGFSPDQLAEGRRQHEAASDKPFDEVSFMRTNKPLKIQSRPFVIFEAAEQCAEMARKQGWKLVQSVAKAKGGR